MEAVFAFLFKYRPFVFEKGHFALGAPGSTVGFGIIGLVIAGALVLSYTQARGKSEWRDRAILAALRVGVVAVLVFCLLRPKLVLSTVIPQRTFLGVLVDDSRSMQIADLPDGARAKVVQRLVGSADSTLARALSEKFMLRFFRFSSGAERVGTAAEATFAGKQTHLGRAMDEARQELAGVPLSGLVVLSDGADNSGEGLTEELLALKAASVPVFTVGIGEERFARDVELTRVDAPREVLRGSSLMVDLQVRQSGYRGSRVTVYVEDAGRIVGSREVELPADGQTAAVRVHFTAGEAGPRVFRFRIPPQPGELVPENNQQDALIVVSDRREKILYFEGQPRWEVKYIRRAIEPDQNVQVVVLQRTAPDKFYRLDVDSASELLGGFPKTREELYQYRGLILGSVEAGFFTPDQLRMIADFVSVRGGGLLTLGGRHSFAEGGYAGTAVADVLPVVLDAPASASGGEDDPFFFAEMTVEPTPAGLVHPAMQIASTEEATAKRWKELPPVTTLNPISRVKPGATTLLTGTGRNLPRRQVVLAHQRYGRGKSAAFTLQDSWLWQMDYSIPLEDLTHETLWRQLLRWLVADVPPQISAVPSRDRVSPGEPVTLTAEVDDDRFLRVNDAQVTARVIDPTGKQQDVPMEWTVNRDGEYRASFTPQVEGIYQVQVRATEGGDELPGGVTWFQSTPQSTEYFDAGMHRGVLQRIADETGGRFYTPGTVSALPEDVSYTESGAAVVEERDLWDMPVIFLIVLALIGAEWGYRRARGLA